MRPNVARSSPIRSVSSCKSSRMVDAAIGPEALPDRARPSFLDTRLAEVVAQALQRRWVCLDLADDDGQGAHEVDEPGKKRPALQKVVVALDQLFRWVKPAQAFQADVLAILEKPPDSGPRSQSVGRVGLEDEQRCDNAIGHPGFSGSVSLSRSPGVKNLASRSLSGRCCWSATPPGKSCAYL